jgi:hypothetical protein
MGKSNIRVKPKFQEKPDVEKLIRALIAVSKKMKKEEESRRKGENMK